MMGHGPFGHATRGEKVGGRGEEARPAAAGGGGVAHPRAREREGEVISSGERGREERKREEVRV